MVDTPLRVFKRSSFRAEHHDKSSDSFINSEIYVFVFIFVLGFVRDASFLSSDKGLVANTIIMLRLSTSLSFQFFRDDHYRLIRERFRGSENNDCNLQSQQEHTSRQAVI